MNSCKSKVREYRAFIDRYACSMFFHNYLREFLQSQQLSPNYIITVELLSRFVFEDKEVFDEE